MRLKTYVGIIAGLVLIAALTFMSWPIDVTLRVLDGSTPTKYVTTGCGNGWSMDAYYGNMLEGYYRECTSEIAGRRILSWPLIVVSVVVLVGALVVGRQIKRPASQP